MFFRVRRLTAMMARIQLVEHPGRLDTMALLHSALLPTWDRADGRRAPHLPCRHDASKKGGEGMQPQEAMVSLSQRDGYHQELKVSWSSTIIN
jgi:hypothetical protein